MIGRLLAAVVLALAVAAVVQAGVNSWKQRTGHVVPKAGDYSCAQVSGCPGGLPGDLLCHGHECANKLCLDPPPCAPGEVVTDIDQLGNPTCTSIATVLAEAGCSCVP